MSAAPPLTDTLERKPHSPWRAKLDLHLARRGGKTVLAHTRHRGPLYIQQPFYPEGDAVCHLYILHPPSGLVGGDELTVRITAASNAEAVVTTPASSKFYRTAGEPSKLQQLVTVQDSARLEWLPQEALLFGGSRAEIQTRIQLHRHATFVGWEISALGRPLSGDHYEVGTLDQRFELFVDDKPALLERQRLSADSPARNASWGLQGRSVFATLYAYPSPNGLLDSVRSALSAEDKASTGATQIDDLLVVRALADNVEACRAALEATLPVIRPAVVGRAYSEPRIWRT